MKGKEDFSLGKIYKIISNNPDITEVYYGSTCQRLLSSRMASHRACYKRWLAGKSGWCATYDLFEKYGVEQFHIELIEDFPCENREQLHTQENIYIRGNECVNKHSAIRTLEEKKEYMKQYSKQYSIDNKEKLKQYDKKYQIANKETISIKKKQKIKCECGCEISREGLIVHIKTEKHKSLIASNT